MLPYPQYGGDENSATNNAVISEEDAEAERLHIQKVVNAFQYYRKYANIRLSKTEAYLNSLPSDDQKMLSNYRVHLDCVRTCIDRNQAVIKQMMCQGVLYPTDKNLSADNQQIRHQDMDHCEQNDDDVEPFKILKAQSTLKSIARDWSSECAAEREQSYKPIIDAIEEYFKPKQHPVNSIKILVPGAGLGRLLYELACCGYDCEGNEFSYFMLIASNFVLNQCTKENAFVLYPWVHQYTNNLRRSDQVIAVRFPDVCPAKHPPKGSIMMAAGDFLEVYNMPNVYDCVATCFFIDCANNVIDFVRTIYKILVPGGIWVNLGPLLYHYSDIHGENSIEPTYEDLILIMESVGFKILNTRTGVVTKYAQNPQSMLKTEYESLFWVCKKPINAQEAQIIDDAITDKNETNNNNNNEAAATDTTAAAGSAAGRADAGDEAEAGASAVEENGVADVNTDDRQTDEALAAGKGDGDKHPML